MSQFGGLRLQPGVFPELSGSARITTTNRFKPPLREAQWVSGTPLVSATWPWEMPLIEMNIRHRVCSLNVGMKKFAIVFASHLVAQRKNKDECSCLQALLSLDVEIRMCDRTDKPSCFTSPRPSTAAAAGPAAAATSGQHDA